MLIFTRSNRAKLGILGSVINFKSNIDIMNQEKRLNLYQVFINVYENDPDLFNKILQLEKSDNVSPVHIEHQYIIGIVQEQEIYLITNLLKNQTKSVFQQQNNWTIGRDRKSSLAIHNNWLSRSHAAIQYIDNQGFYLSDLNSTNGTFINNELVDKSILLADGDRITLGNLTFFFFLCQASLTVDNNSRQPNSHDLDDTEILCNNSVNIDEQSIQISDPLLVTAQESEILKHFFN